MKTFSKNQAVITKEYEMIGKNIKILKVSYLLDTYELGRTGVLEEQFNDEPLLKDFAFFPQYYYFKYDCLLNEQFYSFYKVSRMFKVFTYCSFFHHSILKN
jgi:hypothetical protein